MKNQNLNTEAAKFNLCTFENLPNEYKGIQTLSESFSRDYSEMFKDSKPLPPVGFPDSIPVYCYLELRKQYKNFTNEVELYYIDHSYTIYETPKGRLALSRTTKGKTSFYPYYGYFAKFQNIDYHLREELLKPFNLVEPNQIGKFTEKKVLDWLQYVDLYIDAMEQVLSQFEEKLNQKKSEFDSIIEQFKGCDITRSKEGNTCWIQTPLFYIVLELNPKTNYISKKIDYRGSIQDAAKITNLLK